MDKLKIIGIHSVPRSGSSWLGSLIDSHPDVSYKFQPFFSNRYKDLISDLSSKEEIDRLFEMLYFDNDDDFINLRLFKENKIYPVFPKRKNKVLCYKEVRYHYLLENLLEKTDELKVIGIIRNPFEVLFSWYLAPSEFRKDLNWNFHDEWMDAPSKNLNRKEEYNGFLKWLEVSKLFYQLKLKFPEKFHVISYFNLKTKPFEELRNIMNFIGMETHGNQLQYLNSQKNNYNYDYRSVLNNKQEGKNWENFINITVRNEILKMIDLSGEEVKSFLTSLKVFN
jgi:hypothetical protein